MTSISLVYHSGYGHTQKLAEAVIQGIKQTPGAMANLLAIDANGDLNEAGWQTLKESDAIIFGSPTYMGSVSWQFKKFADASSKPWFADLWKNKIAAGITNSASFNGDKLSTLHYFVTLAQQHGMIWVGPALKASNTKSAKRNDVNYLGSFIGLMSQSPSDSSPDEGPLPGDLETGKLFGKRIAEITHRWVKAA